MDDVTNQQLLDKMKEGFNKLLAQTNDIRETQALIVDKLEPTYTNARNIHAMVWELKEEVEKLNAKLSQLQEEVDRLSPPS